MTDQNAEVVVVTFEDRNQAQKALRSLNEADRADLIDIHEGALVSRDVYGEIHIDDLKLIGFDDLVRNSVGIALNVAVSGTGLLLVTAFEGLRILSRGGWQLAGLATALLASPLHRMRDTIIPDSRVKTVGADLEPGGSAVVAVVNADVATDLAAELERRGGVIFTATEDIEVVEEVEIVEEIEVIEEVVD